MSVPIPVAAKYTEVEGLRLHYLIAGEGEPILLLHGWPTSAYLWRQVMGPLAQVGQVIALDLPGFGNSDKPLAGSYSFGYYERALDGFLERLGLSQVTLVVHDLGGPIGLRWAVRHPEKVRRLVLLNTVVYPEFSWATRLFVVATFVPLVKSWLTSAAGIKAALRFGVENKQQLTEEVLSHYQQPFQSKEARQVLLKTAQRLSLAGFREIAEKLPRFTIPVSLVYGAKDRILPDVAATMARVQRDLPQAQLLALPNCGHFLQEDAPEELAEVLVNFIR